MGSGRLEVEGRGDAQRIQSVRQAVRAPVDRGFDDAADDDLIQERSGISVHIGCLKVVVRTWQPGSGGNVQCGPPQLLRVHNRIVLAPSRTVERSPHVCRISATPRADHQPHIVLTRLGGSLRAPAVGPDTPIKPGAEIARLSTDVAVIEIAAMELTPLVPNCASMTGGSSRVRNVCHLLRRVRDRLSASRCSS